MSDVEALLCCAVSIKIDYVLLLSPLPSCLRAAKLALLQAHTVNTPVRTDPPEETQLIHYGGWGESGDQTDWYSSREAEITCAHCQQRMD